MSSSEVDAYLEKEISSGGKIVTYRLLSRKLSIHVNAAKNALSSFYSRKRANNEPIYATFWLSGEPNERVANGAGDEMEVDGEDNRDWSKRKVMIVGEEDVDRARTTFKEIHAVHVYSLSPAPLDSSSQLSGPSQEVRELDEVGGDGLSKIVGKVVSKQVKRGKATGASKKPTAPNVTASAKLRTSAPSTSNPSSKETPKPSPKPSEPLKSVIEVKPKASGKLSWAKAKPKVTKEQPVAEAIIKVEEMEAEQSAPSNQKRGTKRKSDVRIKEETKTEPDMKPEKELLASRKSTPATPAPVIPASFARIKKGVVLSDDEDENPVSKPKRSTEVAARDLDESDAEQSVRAIMDIDESLVTKASRPTGSTYPEEEAEEPPPTDHAESAMDEDSDDPAPKAKPRKRQQKKKSVPIGRNGLRKKRVVKSKTDFDEKGYMVTVDYSSYESVDEEEQEEEAPKEPKSRAKPKPAATKRSSAQKAGDADASETGVSKNDDRGMTKKAEPRKVAPKKPLKATSSKDRQANGSQKSLASFFGPGGGKTKK